MPVGGLEKFKAIGVDPGHLMAAYAPHTWVSALAVSCELLFPGLPASEAHRRLGNLYMEGFANTLMGKALFVLGRTIGAARMLPRMTRNFRTANNFIDTQLVRLDERTWRLEVLTQPAALPSLKLGSTAPPAFIQGLLEVMLRLGGHRDIEVTIAEVDEGAQRSTFLLRFDASQARAS